jgi:hypothetical protein
MSIPDAKVEFVPILLAKDIPYAKNISTLSTMIKENAPKTILKASSQSRKVPLRLYVAYILIKAKTI